MDTARSRKEKSEMVIEMEIRIVDGGSPD